MPLTAMVVISYRYADNGKLESHAEIRGPMGFVDSVYDAFAHSDHRDKVERMSPMPGQDRDFRWFRVRDLFGPCISKASSFRCSLASEGQPPLTALAYAFGKHVRSKSVSYESLPIHILTQFLAKLLAPRSDFTPDWPLIVEVADELATIPWEALFSSGGAVPENLLVYRYVARLEGEPPPLRAYHLVRMLPRSPSMPTLPPLVPAPAATHMPTTLTEAMRDLSSACQTLVVLSPAHAGDMLWVPPDGFMGPDSLLALRSSEEKLAAFAIVPVHSSGYRSSGMSWAKEKSLFEGGRWAVALASQSAYVGICLYATISHDLGLEVGSCLAACQELHQPSGVSTEYLTLAIQFFGQMMARNPALRLRGPILAMPSWTNVERLGDQTGGVGSETRVRELAQRIN